VKNVAKKHDMIATMMPKPIALDNGSGMHVNGKIARISSLMQMINMQKYQSWQGILVVAC
jgi:glutamine synthetase